MNEPDTQISLHQISEKIDEIALGLKWMVILLTLLASAPNFCLSICISRFDSIFHDVMPGNPLPLLTVAVMQSSSFLILLTFIWPLLAVLNVIYGKSLKVWIIRAAAIMSLIGLQFCLTWMGCLLPFFVIYTGMSDSGTK